MTTSSFGLPQETIDLIRNYFEQNPYIELVKIYGSRAKGNFRNGSDIDFAVWLKDGGETSRILGDLDELNMQGDRYNQIQGMKILKNLSVNEGAGGIASAGAGIGVGMAAGSVMGDIARSVFAPMQSTQQPQMPTYQQGGSSRFGQPTQTEEPKEDPMEKLANLKKMLDAGLIEQAEYDSVKSEILKKMM